MLEDQNTPSGKKEQAIKMVPFPPTGKDEGVFAAVAVIIVPLAVSWQQAK
jgi:hypothetical protein